MALAMGGSLFAAIPVYRENDIRSLVIGLLISSHTPIIAVTSRVNGVTRTGS
jgi:hypothetical protein